MDEVRPRQPGAALTHARIRARTRARAGNCLHAHAHTKAQRISRPIGSRPSAICPAEGRASTAPVAPESPMPRPVQRTFILIVAC